MIDRDYFKNRRSVGEVGCVKTMMVRGCKVKTYYPGGNGFASLHMKSWLLDGVVLLTGSMNMTTQSLDYNVEELIVIMDAEICRQKMELMEAMWDDDEHTRLLQARDLDEVANAPTQWERSQLASSATGATSSSATGAFSSDRTYWQCDPASPRGDRCFLKGA